MSHPTAFVIEDDTDLAQIFAQALQVAGYKTEVLHDGHEALARLATETPYLVVLDMHLPFVSGITILDYIRSTEHLKGIKVIVATADLSTTLGEVQDKASLVLAKPVSFSQLSMLAKRLLLPRPG